MCITEKFDIIDINGNRTGEVSEKGKGTLLKDGQYYLGVHAYIYNSRNEFLLQQRALDKEFLPGGWDIHMGHVIAGETSKNGIIREIQEEIGLHAQDDRVRLIGRVIWEIYHHMIDIYFLQNDFEIDELRFQRDEVIGAKVVSVLDMLTLVSKMDYRPKEYRTIVSAEIKRLIIQ